MKKKRYDANEVIAETGISQSALSRAVNGYKSWNKAKTKYWTITPLLTEKVDYTRTTENGRAKIYYYDSAIAILRVQKQDTAPVAANGGGDITDSAVTQQVQ